MLPNKSNRGEALYMKTLTLVLFLLVPITTFASQPECKKLYLSVHRSYEKKAALELQTLFKNELKIELINSIEIPLYSTIENETNPLLENNSTIIVLSEETDMTGSEIRIETYKTDKQGRIHFSGGQTNTSRFQKTKALIALGQTAINFSCQLPGYN